MSDGPQVDCSRSEGEGLLSPKKLQRSIWNQVAEVPPSISPNPHLNLPSSLSLRSINLAPSLPAVLHQSKHHASHINSLDISYSIVEARTVSALCRAFGNLQSLSAVNCGLEELDSEMPWPKGLKRIDLSRNKLNKFPNGIACLMYLETLNISGNLIRTVDPAVLQLPSLQKLYLLNNPIQDIPRHVCRAGVSEMRRYLHVEPLPLPEEESEQLRSRRKSLSSKNLRKFLREHTWTESTESGYDSPYQRVLSTSSCSSLSDIHHDLDLQWPTFHSDTLPKGYTQVASGSLCQVYLPEECGESVHIEIVKDLSLHPQVHSNELLITPVVRITPHGMMFPMDKPAIVALSHCARPRSQGQEEMVPLCSDTGLYEPPTWTRLESDHRCEVFHDCVTFSTTHFSLFAVVSVLPYPFAKAEINPDEGGILTVPELPGFELYIPPGSIDIPVTLQATVYYANHTESDIDGNLSLATACVGLEPHGMEFTTPVCVSIPVPDFASIKASFQDAQLQLWCSPYINEHTFHWEHVSNTNISVQEGIELNGHVATFQVNHFSFFELLWTICRDTLQRLGYGASFVYNQLPSRTRYVSVRCQVFMSHPLNDLTFGILVAVYKFGDPLTELSNYKWKLADTGNKRMFLRTGELRVSLEGCFEPRGEVGETTLSRRTDIEFSGEDFCLRFEFALRLRDLPLPLADHQLIGKMHIHQWDGTTLMELNLIKVSRHHPSIRNDTSLWQCVSRIHDIKFFCMQPVEGSNTAFSSQTPGPTCTPTMLQQTAQYST